MHLFLSRGHNHLKLSCYIIVYYCCVLVTMYVSFLFFQIQLLPIYHHPIPFHHFHYSHIITNYFIFQAYFICVQDLIMSFPASALDQITDFLCLRLTPEVVAIFFTQFIYLIYQVFVIICISLYFHEIVMLSFSFITQVIYFSFLKAFVYAFQAMQSTSNITEKNHTTLS